MTGWINVFPDEMELGDIGGEMGRLVIREPNFYETSWTLIWCSHDEDHYGEDGDTRSRSLARPSAIARVAAGR